MRKGTLAVTALALALVATPVSSVLAAATQSSNNPSTTQSGNNATTATTATATATAAAASSGSVYRAVAVNWENVQTQIADTTEGNLDIVTGGTVNVSAATLDKLAGKNVVMALHVGNGIAVSISGQDLNAAGTELKMTFTDKVQIPENVQKEVLDGALSSKVFAMEEKGAYGVKLDIHFHMGVQFAGKYANLYHYDETLGRMVCDGSFLITDKGQAMFALLAGDDYIVTVTEEIPAGVGTVYTVAAGDTMSGIAAKNGVTLNALLAANTGIQDVNKIVPGQQITIVK